MFGTRRGQAVRLFSLFVEERTGDVRKNEFHRGGEFDCRLIGNESFVDEALEKVQMRRELKRGGTNLQARCIPLSARIKRMTDKARFDSVIAGKMELVKQALMKQVTQHG